VDQLVLGLQMLFGVAAEAHPMCPQALEVDDGGGQAAAAETVKSPDRDHVNFSPSGVGEQVSILPAPVCAFAMRRFPRGAPGL
jgi:hypothetical protein